MQKEKQAIIKTLAFYSLWQRPLKKQELYERLSVRCDFCDFDKAIYKLTKTQKIDQKFGYVFLAGEEKIVAKQIQRLKIIDQYFKKVGRILRFLKIIPFLKTVAVINSLSFQTVNENSDIDIFLICAKNRLWTVRALTVAILELLGVNKQKNKIAGRFCLGFAIDEKRLDLSSIRLKDDPYLTYWLANLEPVFDTGAYKKFIQANSWLFDELPNWSVKKIVSKSNINFFQKILSGKFGDFLEKFLAKIQIKRVWQDPKSRRRGGTVVADESMLKLHPYDKRQKYKSDLDKKMASLLK